MSIYQYKPNGPRPKGFEGLPYGLRVRLIGKPDSSGMVRVKNLQNKILGLVPMSDLEVLR